MSTTVQYSLEEFLEMDLVQLKLIYKTLRKKIKHVQRCDEHTASKSDKKWRLWLRDRIALMEKKKPKKKSKKKDVSVLDSPPMELKGAGSKSKRQNSMSC